MLHFLIVALGGALGASGRHLTGLISLKILGAAFPYGTLSVNILGSFLMGVLIAFLVKKTGFSHEWRLFLATGFLGGFTTFSAFSLDAISLWEKGAYQSAFLYVVASVIFSLLALYGGLMLVRATH